MDVQVKVCDISLNGCLRLVFDVTTPNSHDGMNVITPGVVLRIPISTLWSQVVQKAIISWCSKQFALSTDDRINIPMP